LTGPGEITDLTRLCVHTQTNRPWNLFRCIESYSEAGIHGISVWRHLLEGIPVPEIRKKIDQLQLKVVSLVRGGFFASVKAESRKNAIEDNRKAVREAEMIGAPLLVLVCGADPGQSQEHSRDQILEGISAILPLAEQTGVRLAIEPLHPMYAADRSAVTTIKQANNIVADLDSEFLGIAVDVFHLWWDPELKDEIFRCGRMGKLFAFHVSDWKPDMADMLNDRGLMGEGCIDLKRIRGWMEEAGFTGFHEVEVFSEKYWTVDQELYLKRIVEAYLKHC
jgi:sugar phosphate isomerase/epimerase